MKRVMCVYFPDWPMQRLLHARSELRDRPAAIVQPGTKRGAIIRLACPRALRAGVRPGMPVAEAHATLPALSIHDEDLAADLRALKKLAAWAERYSPIVGLEEGPAPECLLLDVTGCADCFHGEDRLAERAAKEFREQGWIVRVAIADTIGAAWAVCHPMSSFSAHRILRALNESLANLQSLPIAALRLPDNALRTLTALGFERIEQLLAMPRAALAGRVDPLVLRRLDQLLGRVPEPVVSCKTPPEVQARCSFEIATDRRAFLDHALDQLVRHVVAMLRQQARGAKHVECWFFHERSPPSRVDVRLFRPTQEFAHLWKLLEARLEQLRLPEAVCGICVRVPVVEPLAQRQYDLFDGESSRENELSALIDRLVSRLGRDAVTFATLVDDPQPEYACRFDSVVSEERGTRDEGRGKGKQPKKNKAGKLLFDDASLIPSTQYSVLSTPYSACGIRPSFLLRPVPLLSTLLLDGVPARFLHAGQEHAVAQLWGPERIETGWWRGLDVRRDYYIVETDAGTRWWIFQRHDGQWFVQGCFD